MQNFIMDSDILMQLRHLNKCLKADFDKRLESYGLTGHQGRVLVFINCSNEEGLEIHQSDLEKRMCLSKSSISEMITRMSHNGLICRTGNKPNIKLVPTEKAKSILNEIKESRKETISKLLKGFTQEDITILNKYISNMIANINKEDELCGKK